jgi:uncharacterized membrane protein
LGAGGPGGRYQLDHQGLAGLPGWGFLMRILPVLFVAMAVLVVGLLCVQFYLASQ